MPDNGEKTVMPTESSPSSGPGAPVPPSEGVPEPSPKMKQRKKLITIGVIVGIVVVAIVGFWVWHNTPGFCGICHSPMSYYVDTYDDENPNMGVTVHQQNGKACLDCHEATLTTQVTEVMNWISDNYPMDAEGVMLASGQQFADEEFCARSGCHADANNMNQVIAKTWGFEGNDEKYNPHQSHQQFALKCYDCHGIHETNILVCNQCHNLNMPEGWVTPNEAIEAGAKAESEAAASSNPESTVPSLGPESSTEDANGTFNVPDNGEQGA